jgi:hypothetical protein
MQIVNFISIAALISVALLLAFFLFTGVGYIISIVCKLKCRILIVNAWLGFIFVYLLTDAAHLFTSIDWKASLVVVLFGAVGFLGYSKNLSLNYVKDVLKRPSKCFASIACIVAVCLMLISIAIHSPTNLDSGLYHFQSIKWVNEYPVVQGLGNLHKRLGYNQSYFSIAALFNFFPVFDRGYVILNLLTLLLTIFTIIKINIQDLLLNKFIKILLFFAVMIEGSNLSSPSPDQAIFLLQIAYYFLIIKILTDSDQESSLVTYGPLVIAFAVLLPTIKLSAAFFSVTAFLVLLLIKVKKENLVLFSPRLFGVFGLLAFCHLAKGLVLTGMPFFPSSFLGLSDVLSWAVPFDIANKEVAEISHWARYPGGVVPSYEGFTWIIHWASLVATRYKVIFFIILFLLMINIGMLLLRRVTLSLNYRAYGAMLFSVGVSLGLWFITAPDPRFAGALIYIALINLTMMTLTLAGSRLSNFSLQRSKSTEVTLLVIGLFAAVLSYNFRPHSLGYQQVPHSDTYLLEINSGLSVNVPSSADLLCWNAPLPCTPYATRSYKIVPAKGSPGFEAVLQGQ